MMLLYDYAVHLHISLQLHYLLSLLLFIIFKFIQACGQHNQVITYEHLLKDKFACFTSFANEDYSYIHSL